MTMSVFDTISTAANDAAAAAGAGIHAAQDAVVVCKDGVVRKRGECGPGNEPEGSSSSSSSSSLVPILLIGGVVAAALYFGTRKAKPNGRAKKNAKTLDSRTFDPLGVGRQQTPGRCPYCGDDSDWHSDGRGTIYCGCRLCPECGELDELDGHGAGCSLEDE